MVRIGSESLFKFNNAKIEYKTKFNDLKKYDVT